MRLNPLPLTHDVPKCEGISVGPVANKITKKYDGFNATLAQRALQPSKSQFSIKLMPVQAQGAKPLDGPTALKPLKLTLLQVPCDSALLEAKRQDGCPPGTLLTSNPSSHLKPKTLRRVTFSDTRAKSSIATLAEAEKDDEGRYIKTEIIRRREDSEALENRRIAEQKKLTARTEAIQERRAFMRHPGARAIDFYSRLESLEEVEFDSDNSDIQQKRRDDDLKLQERLADAFVRKEKISITSESFKRAQALARSFSINAESKDYLTAKEIRHLVAKSFNDDDQDTSICG
ncbi:MULTISPECIES: hypothetical protein [unclassified Caballeronia]|uniref:hypothetical protein n=1 Tax=unclassified Caballeronia TaxID=2646786 RepID=UPI0020296B5F|nr:MULTISPECIES: hypothetical protein [unclassified Caballeronia]